MPSLSFLLTVLMLLHAAAFAVGLQPYIDGEEKMVAGHSEQGMLSVLTLKCCCCTMAAGRLSVLEITYTDARKEPQSQILITESLVFQLRWQQGAQVQRILGGSLVRVFGDINGTLIMVSGMRYLTLSDGARNASGLVVRSAVVGQVGGFTCFGRCPRFWLRPTLPKCCGNLWYMR